MRGIQRINELEAVQGRLDYCIPKQEIGDALQYGMEGSCLNGISVPVLCTAIVQLLTAVQRKQSLYVEGASSYSCSQVQTGFSEG